MRIRNSAKAVIVDNGKLLTIKMFENGETYYILPGGGQEHGENLLETLNRECLEELGAKVGIGDLIFVREYIGKNHEFAAHHDHVHQIEFVFLCHLNQEMLKTGENPDHGQVGTEWIAIKELMEYKLFPQDLRKHLISYFDRGNATTYVGDIN